MPDTGASDILSVYMAFCHILSISIFSPSPASFMLTRMRSPAFGSSLMISSASPSSRLFCIDRFSGRAPNCTSYPFFGHEAFRRFVDFQPVSEVLHPLVQSFQLDVDDAYQRVDVELVERDDFIQTVDELGRERFVECLRDDSLRVLLVVRTVLRGESDASAELLELACAHV